MRAVPNGRAARWSTVAGLAALTISSCGGNDEVSQAAKDGGIVISGGLVEITPPARRTTPLRATGTTLEGDPVDTVRYAGQVVVLNTWGSWCAPCVREAPALEATWKSFKGKGVQFLGVNVGESSVNGKAFQRKYSITYPSIADGEPVRLQLRGKAASTPNTLVLDRQGRLAARANGQIDQRTLTGMIDDVLAEPH